MNNIPVYLKRIPPPPPPLTAPTDIYCKWEPACVRSNVYNSTSAPNGPNIGVRAPLCKYKTSLFPTPGKEGRDSCSFSGYTVQDFDWSIDNPKYLATLPLIFSFIVEAGRFLFGTL